MIFNSSFSFPSLAKDVFSVKIAKQVKNTDFITFLKAIAFFFLMIETLNFERKDSESLLMDKKKIHFIQLFLILCQKNKKK